MACTTERFVMRPKTNRAHPTDNAALAEEDFSHDAGSNMDLHAQISADLAHALSHEQEGPLQNDIRTAATPAVAGLAGVCWRCGSHSFSRFDGAA